MQWQAGYDATLADYPPESAFQTSAHRPIPACHTRARSTGKLVDLSRISAAGRHANMRLQNCVCVRSDRREPTNLTQKRCHVERIQRIELWS